LKDKRILLIISGGIAAYKSLDLIRRLRERGASVRPVMTKGAEEFVTPLAVGALSGGKVFTELFSREEEQDVGHIRLARECDLILVAPATADLMAKMANGLANDLASAVLLAADRPVLVAPAMNPKMWTNPATARNVETLKGDGIRFIGPMKGEMAESGEAGLGRMAEPLEIVAAVEALLDGSPKPLAGRRAIVTSGPTHEPIDPVRYIANRSSGRQGHAIAAALAALGAEVTLVSGPVTIPDPAGVKTLHVETAREMLEVVEASLPEAGRCAAGPAAHRKSGYPEDRRSSRRKAEAGRRLCRGNAGCRNERPDEAGAQGRRFHRRQRRLARNRRHGRHAQQREDHLGERRGCLAGSVEGRCGGTACRDDRRSVGVEAYCFIATAGMMACGMPAGSKTATSMPCSLTMTALPPGISIQVSASSFSGSETRQ
jgi:phosphopantothenoylcysteine decarboxylase/phosphopantothenate--cysteine ligase